MNHPCKQVLALNKAAVELFTSIQTQSAINNDIEEILESAYQVIKSCAKYVSKKKMTVKYDFERI